MIESTRRRFGACILIDCHSMPSIGGPMDADKGANRVDMVLGDCHGTSCAPAITDRLAERAGAEGFSVVRNNPYAGGYTTRHYGRPADGVHALQIEINRELYMDERAIALGPGLAALTDRIEGLVEALANIDLAAVAPP
jgi:N-formylglutamate amidohydrolase